jgi:hypothetical protein
MEENTKSICISNDLIFTGASQGPLQMYGIEGHSFSGIYHYEGILKTNYFKKQSSLSSFLLT